MQNKPCATDAGQAAYLQPVVLHLGQKLDVYGRDAPQLGADDEAEQESRGRHAASFIASTCSIALCIKGVLADLNGSSALLMACPSLIEQAGKVCIDLIRVRKT